MPYDDYEMLTTEREGYVLTVTLNNPPMNQMTRRMHYELSRIFRDINEDAETRVVIVTGSGDRAFSAGGDINLMAQRIEQADHARWIQGNQEGKDMLRALLDLEKPLIGRINGHAMGFGATLAAFCDISYIVSDAKIADNHVKVGLAAGDGGALLWPLKMGFWRAKEYLLTGDPLTGAQAAQFGLISHSVPREELDGAVSALAGRLAAGAPKAIYGTKSAIHHVLKRLLDPSIDMSFAMETVSYLGADHAEAVFAFRDKRQPNFTGG